MNCHTVPQAYLRRFADKNDRVFVYNKESMAKPFTPNVSNVATERDFYIVPVEIADQFEVDPKFIETGYSRMVDGDLLRNVHDLLGISSDVKFDLTTKVRAAQYILFQYFRTRSGLNQLKLLCDRFYQSFCNQATVLRYGEENRHLSPIASFKERNASIMMSDMLFDRNKTHPMVTALCTRQWYLWENRTDRGLLTSDTPVVLNPLRRKLSATAFLSDATRIYFPITPRLLVEISEQPFAGYARDTLPRRALTRSLLGSVNKLQIVQCDRLLISDKNDFKQVEENCRLDPSLRIPGTMRIGGDLLNPVFPPEWVAKAVEEDLLREVEVAGDES